nr:hypothetical protein [Tanacetum cinerariifolium]
MWDVEDAPRLEFCAGEGGLKSWEWCGGSGVDWRRGEVVLWGWREKRVEVLQLEFCAGEGGLKSWEWCGAPRLEFCAGEGGLKSWEWCGGSRVDWRRGEVVLWGWREKRVEVLQCLLV